MKLNNILLFACFVICISACKPDAAKNTVATNGTESHDGHDHSGHDHAGHDHSTHDHGTITDSKAADDQSKYEGMSDAEITKMKTIEKANAEKLVSNKSKSNVNISTRGIPNPCQLITTEWIKSNTSLDIGDARIKEGNRGAAADNRSCFMQWEQNGDPNTGFLINIAINPAPEEIEEYPEVFMQAKRSDGETMMGSDKPFPYKRLDNLGVEALGCHELGKYYFRYDNEYLFMIAFNLEMSERDQRNTVTKIGNEVIKNFRSIIK